ncbi:peptidase inhibitor family I36 protein [Streptomyces globisporus]|uniref:peptidase inhibitor family I36 protein n=1 Tax=Streptomyces globisporus TaxID=1908 RepID=UPI0004C498F6|nr:peptidase inhibitor family I36 protein [Streptomyces globisporus]
MYTKTVLTGAAVTALLLTALTAAPAAPMAPTGRAEAVVRAVPAAAQAGAPPSGVAPPGTVLGACGPGRLCLWPKPDFKGRPWTHELATTDIDSCVALPPGTSAQSLANRTGRPVTTYQSAECGETGEFETYPGRGTWVPQTAYEVRAFKLWER